jgi:hypothetical protein
VRVEVEEKSEPRVLRVYLHHIFNTPPIVDSGRWREKQKQRERPEGNKAKDAKEG